MTGRQSPWIQMGRRHWWFVCCFLTLDGFLGRHVLYLIVNLSIDNIVMCAQNLSCYWPVVQHGPLFIYSLGYRAGGGQGPLMWTVQRQFYIVQSELLSAGNRFRNGVITACCRHLHSWPRPQFSENRHEILKILPMPPHRCQCIWDIK